MKKFFLILIFLFSGKIFAIENEYVLSKHIHYSKRGNDFEVIITELFENNKEIKNFKNYTSKKNIFLKCYKKDIIFYYINLKDKDFLYSQVINYYGDIEESLKFNDGKQKIHFHKLFLNNSEEESFLIFEKSGIIKKIHIDKCDISFDA